MFESIIADDATVVFVAELNDEIIGYVLGLDHPTFFANGRVAWVEELFVTEQHRRQGIATQLMKAIEEWAQQRSCTLIALATRRAANFYSAIGYNANAEYFSKKL